VVNLADLFFAAEEHAATTIADNLQAALAT
jgi:hypothetical protein